MMFFGKIADKSDEDLMVMLAKGKKAAFDELYSRYSKRLWFFFFRMLHKDQEKAEDFTHDLFVKLIERPELYNSEKKFSTWIFSIANNMCKNEYKKLDVRSAAAEELLHTSEHYIETVEKKLDEKSFMKALQDELIILDEKHRSVFLLRYKENFSLKEIAEMLDCSEGTVKSRLFYGLKKLSEKLKDYDPKHIKQVEHE
jgi:RNA polymerase sigma-70 factor (ECF subfamily)